MSTEWTYEGYWAVVVGAHLNAADAVREHEICEDGAEEWVDHAERDALEAGGLVSAPREWAEFRARAIGELEAEAFAQFPHDEVDAQCFCSSSPWKEQP